jgi:multiple sugar transport system ATP-binding protein
VEAALDRKPKQLSGGQRQRVAVGRAIVRQPSVFLFDEPLSNLDAKLRVQMRTEIARLHSRLKATMLYVTHDQVEAMTMGDRIVVLKDGHIQQIDTPLHLYHHPANRFVAGFIGSPAMNFVEGAVARGDGGLVFHADEGAFTLPLDAAHADRLQGHLGQAVTLGVRPESLHVAAEAAPHLSAPVAWQLDVTEPMGNEIVLYVHTGPHEAVARVAPQPLPEPGASLDLAFDLQALHFFDAATGEALGTTVGAATA